MTWFRVGGAGISAALKNAMTAVLNKKLGTSQEYAPNAWPEEVNLLGALEEKTASGSIVTFSDGADDVPIKSCEVALPPSLDGYSSVDVVHCGKNILNGEDAVKTANNIRFYFTNGKYYHAGTYTLSISESVSGIYVRNVSTSANISVKYNTNFITFTLTEQTLIGFDFYKVGINQDDNVMLEVGSTASTFEPYSSAVSTVNLGRTIYGGTADVVNGTGTDGYGYIVFDGSSDETWGGYSAYNGYYIDISDMKSGTRQDGVCNQLTCSKSTAQGQTDAFWLGAGNSRFYVIGVYDSMGNTLEAFRAYLAENPLILVYPLATATDFNFTGQEINTRLGYNAFWSDSGDTEVTYRSSGTQTIITPTLITKTITENGSYRAADDQADGYSEIVVNVPQPTPTVDPIMSLNAFVTKSGVSGTNTSTVARSFTMSAAGTLVFASGTYGFTDTGSNEGYFEIQKNGVSVVKQYCNTNTNTPIAIPEISVEENDVIDLVVGFDNAHSNCRFQFYSAMVVLSEV